MDLAIQALGLEKTYASGVEAVKGIDFDVAPREVFGLLGPNGAGKSTTVGMLTTTIVPTRGAARLAGFDVAAEPLAARADSSVVFKEPVDSGTANRAGRVSSAEGFVWSAGPPSPMTQARTRSGCRAA